MTQEDVRVMLVDDSAVIRGLIARMLEGEVGLKVVASVGNGQIAVDRLKSEKVDVIILDIEMPVMDGITALPLLLKANPDVKIIMASTLTTKNAEISMKALQAGAADYVPKPTSTREISGGDDFKRDLIEKIRALGLVARPAVKSAPVAPVGGAAVAPRKSLYKQPISLRTARASISRPRILAVGSSTGGPQALFEVFKDISPAINMPVVITQHMPATFTAILAEHITKATDWQAAEAKDGEPLIPGRIYVAPGGYHMVVDGDAANVCLRLNQEPPENFCRPAVDPMFRSVAKVYGGACLAIILTGMGQDGLKGGKTLVDAGASLIAQDEESSVVWGMPGAVATAGICDEVLPLGQIGSHVMGRLKAGAA